MDKAVGFLNSILKRFGLVATRELTWEHLGGDTYLAGVRWKLDKYEEGGLKDVYKPASDRI